MLDRQENGLAIRREQGAANLRPGRRLIEKPRQRATMARGIRTIKPIRHTGGRRRAIGRDPAG